MLDLRRLEVLQRFASRGTIAAAAADLGYTASAISQQLATLEREVGVALIERTARSANLTNAGRELAEHASSVLAAAEEAESKMRARAGTISGRVDVSCIPGLAADLAPPLAALQRTHRDLTIVVHETGSDTAAEDVLDRSSDIAVIDDWTESPTAGTSGLVLHNLLREPVVLAVPTTHPAALGGGQASAAILRQTIESEIWLSAPVGQRSRAAGDQRLTDLGVEAVRRWEFDGLHVLARLVATGSGVAFLPGSVADSQSGITKLQLRPRMYRHVIALTRSSHLHDPAITSCLNAAAKAFGDSDQRAHT